MALDVNNHGYGFLNVQPDRLWLKPCVDDTVKMGQSYSSAVTSTVGLVPFYVPWKIQQLCALALHSARHGTNTVWVLFWESGHFGRIFWHGYHPEVVPSLPPLLGSTNQVVLSVFSHRGNAEIGLPAPPSGALYLMTWKVLCTHTHTHSLSDSHTQTHTSICFLTLDPSHRQGIHERRVSASDTGDWF